MKQHVLVTTTADLSIEQFRPFCQIILLDSSQSFDDSSVISRCHSVYIRSQFNNPRTMPYNFTQRIDAIGRIARECRVPIIDQMGTVQEIVDFEDKWQQFQKFGEYMPRTTLATDTALDGGPVIFKKRISSRATGIAWSRREIVGDPRDWVCQALLEVEEELRVYIIRGEVVDIAAVRQNKTVDQKIRVTGVRKITKEEKRFAKGVYQRYPQLDFIGIDVALTPDGPRLIEVNRSPIFSSFTRESQRNLAESLYDKLGI